MGEATPLHGILSPMGFRSVILRWLPRRLAESIELDSRRWIFDCPHCNQTSSIWDVGGVRWKAAGNPRCRVRCPLCGAKLIARIRWENDQCPSSEEEASTDDA